MSARTAIIEYMFEQVIARLRKPPGGAPYDDGMTASAYVVAAEIRRRLPSVGRAKLHKLLYYAQGHHLAAFGHPLFRDAISAWDMGPVVGKLWHIERNDIPMESAAQLDEAALNTIGYVISRYGGLTGRDLIRLSHSDTPWQEANAARTPGTSRKIPVESIRAYFVGLQDEDEESAPPIDDVTLNDLLAGAETRRTEPVATDTIAELRRRRAALSG